MSVKKLKYYLSVTFSIIAYILSAQQSYQSSNSVVTIVGDLPTSENIASTETIAPPIDQPLTSQNKNIEPTLENGFHMRYEFYPNENDDLDSLGGKSYGRMSFWGKPNQIKIYKYNAKKRINHWLPQRKKKYRSNLCEHF